MATRLPFEGTDVSMARSQASLKALLYNVGFQSISEYSDVEGRSIIRGELGQGKNKVQFQFDASIEAIMTEFRSRGNKMNEEDMMKKAQRMAWRSIHYQVKALHDSIKLGSIDVAEAFAGNLLLLGRAGNVTKMSEFIKIGMVEGTLNSASMKEQFLLEGAKE